ncbi:MAG TPA: NAD(P)H-hydrate dehydratase [Patescibacteria group bacterium]|nr:NAD(P)H-hydrate dehydratase [Patescibacteria group bacterium]
MIKQFDTNDLAKLYVPSSTSHKGQNGKLLLIGGSHLFHAASLWSLDIASRIVDMVFYSSVPQNNQIVETLKTEWRNGIIVPRESLEDYIKEADCILLGPGMTRTETVDRSRSIGSLKELSSMTDEGAQTYFLTKFLLEKYPEKKWVIDAGALQMLELSSLKKTKGNVVLTPHILEFERLFGLDPLSSSVEDMASLHNCIIVLKRHADTVCNNAECVLVEGGNAGMTKGGTGDVLAGLIAALACKNDLYLAAKCGSYLNKKAGESLYKKQGLYFNASDLVGEIPKVMRELISPDGL